MIFGTTNSDLEAMVSIDVQDSTGDFHAFQCVVDTGYDGFVALPADAIQRLGLVSRGHRRTILVNGAAVFMPVYLGAVTWHGQPMEVSVLQTEQEFLVGMALIEGSTLAIQVWDGGEVLIEGRPMNP